MTIIDGPIFHLKLGSQDVVVLASGEAIKKIVDKRSSNYADRPALYMQDVWEQSRIIMRRYDDLWKVERRIYHQFLSITKAHRYSPYQDLETKKLCFDLLHEPERWENLITRTTLSAATSMAYGFRVTDTENPVLKELMKNAHGFFTMVHSSKLLDWYPELRPIVKWLPSWVYPLTKQAREVYDREKTQFRDLYNDARKGATSEDSQPSKCQPVLTVQSLMRGKVLRRTSCTRKNRGRERMMETYLLIMRHRILLESLWKVQLTHRVILWQHLSRHD
jgi:hypothetical protein